METFKVRIVFSDSMTYVAFELIIQISAIIHRLYHGNSSDFLKKEQRAQLYGLEVMVLIPRAM